MTDKQSDILSLLLRFSDSRRNYLIRQNYSDDKRSAVRRQNYSYLVFNSIPNMIASTLLFPILRIKILKQTESLRLGKIDSTIEKFALSSSKVAFQGVIISNTLIVLKSISFIIFNDRSKFKGYDDSRVNLTRMIYASISSGIFQSILTYPLDLALTRKASCLNNIKWKSCFEYHLSKYYIKYQALYEGLLYSMVENSINFLAILAFYNIYLYVLPKNIKQEITSNECSFFKKFIFSSLAAFTASLISYPFNTLTKMKQISGFNEEFSEAGKTLFKRKLYERSNLYK